MDWEQIEEDFIKEASDIKIGISSIAARKALLWFKNRIESAQIESAEKLTEEEKSEFYRTDITADIKPKYGN